MKDTKENEPGYQAVSTPNPTQSDDVKSWITWTQFFAIADGVARSINSMIRTGGIPVADENLKIELMASLKGLHAALKDVNNAFQDVINSIKQGQKPEVVINAATIPDWDEGDQNPSLELLKSGWEIAKSAIHLLVQELQNSTHDPKINQVVVAFNALANASDDIIEAVGKVLSTQKVNP